MRCKVRSEPKKDSGKWQYGICHKEEVVEANSLIYNVCKKWKSIGLVRNLKKSTVFKYMYQMGCV